MLRRGPSSSATSPPGATPARSAKSSARQGRPAAPGAGSGRLAHAPGEIRIIGGHWRGTKLPVVSRLGLRPTPDRVRETLFNWLGQQLEGQRCLDLFAGTGALGLEAASRGAAQVVSVEADAAAARSLQVLVDRLAQKHTVPIEVLQSDALAAIGRFTALRQTFDVVFLDPPFDSDLMVRSMAVLAPILAEGARVYLESREPLTAEQFGAGWVLHRGGRAGQVHYYVMLRCNIAP